MPWLTVNQTWLSARAAVPTALLALEVQRGRMPGAPGGVVNSVNRHPCCSRRPLRTSRGWSLFGSDRIRTEAPDSCLTRFLHANRYPLRPKTLWSAGKPALVRSNHISAGSSYRDRKRERNCDVVHIIMTRE